MKLKTINNKKYNIKDIEKAKDWNYKKWINDKKEDFNKLPIYWAFGDQQFQELLKKLNLKDTPEDLKQLVNVGYGGIMRKCDLSLLECHNNTFSSKKLNFWLFHNFNFAYTAFIYEMENHEFGYTYEIDDTLEALGLSLEDISKNALLRLAYLRARKDYLKQYNSCN